MAWNPLAVLFPGLWPQSENPIALVPQDVQSWLGGLGGDLASGLEGGFVSIFKDLGMVIMPWLEILLGILIAIVTLVIYFKEDAARAGLNFLPMLLAA